MMTKTIGIEGMGCMNCVKKVNQALSELEGVDSVTVSLEGKKAVVDLSGTVSDETLKAAVESRGYEVTGIA